MDGNHARALELYEEARKGFEASRDSAGMATVDVHLSDMALKSLDIERALKLRKSAYRLFREAGKGYSQALTLRELGLFESFFGNLEKGLEMMESAIRMFSHLEAHAEAYLTREALINFLGMSPGYDAARIVDHCRILLATREPAPHPSIRVGVYTSLGSAYLYLGDHLTALECYDKALALREESGLPEAKLESVEANRGLALMYLGRYREATQIHGALAARRIARGDEVRAAMSYTNACVAARYDSRLDLAESFLGKAERACRNTRLAVGLLDMAQDLFDTGGRASAAVDAFRAHFAARFALNRGRIEYERGDHRSACKRYQTALASIPRAYRDTWRFYYFHAMALAKLGDIARAEEQLRLAQSRAERIRGKLSEFRQRSAYYDSRGDVFTLLVSLLTGQGKTVEAFETVERHKARCFLDLLASSRTGKQPLVAGALTPSQSERLLERVEARASDEGTRNFAAALRKTVPEVIEQGETVPADPALGAGLRVPGAREAKRLADVQRSLGAKECILEYYLTKDRGYGFMVTRRGIKPWSFGTGRRPMLETVKKWRRHIAEERTARYFAERTESERILFDALLAPVWDALTRAGYETVYVVGDGPLHYVPVQALRSGQGERVLDRFAVCYAPSASILAHLAGLPPRPSAEKLLTIAGPSNDLLPLLFAPREARAAARYFEEPRMLTGEEADKQQVIAALPEYDALHFACHAEMDPVVPAASSLILAGNSRAASSRLRVFEIARLKLRARLAILSACESGLVGGRTRRFPMGDDVEGLARSFMLAGVPTVVATLWHVSDESTAGLVARFARELKRESRPPAQALRTAQLAVSRSTGTGAPHYWAGLCVYGLNR